MELPTRNRNCTNFKYSFHVVHIAFLITLLAVTYLYILATNFSMPGINTSIILAFFLFAIFTKPYYSISIWGFLDVYFSYSYLEFDNYLGLETGQFIAIYLGLVAIRSIFQIVKVVPHMHLMWKVPLIMTLPILLILQHQYIGAVKVVTTIMFCFIFIYNVTNKTYTVKLYVLVLISTLLSTYLYNLIWIQIGHLDDAIRALSGIRYVGVRDSNNFSLLSNIALCLITYIECFKKLKTKKLVTILLCIGITATISISGICTMLVVFYFIIMKRGNAVSRLSKLLIYTPILIVLACVFAYAFSGTEGVIGSVANRFITILSQLSQGEFSDATSSRTYLWGYYLQVWERFTGTEKAIGAYRIYADMITTRLGSHNTYLDIMMTYGLIGLSVSMLSFFMPSVRRLNKELWLLKIIAAVNIFARSFDPLGMVLLYFLL